MRTRLIFKILFLENEDLCEKNLFYYFVLILNCRIIPFSTVLRISVHPCVYSFIKILQGIYKSLLSLSSDVWNFDWEFRKDADHGKMWFWYVVHHYRQYHWSSWNARETEGSNQRGHSIYLTDGPRVFLCCLCQWQTQKMLLTVMKSSAIRIKR